MMDMPCGPGVHWTYKDREGNEREFYTKQTLLPGSSLAEFRFLLYLMYKDERFFDSSGTPYPMAHAFYQKQAKIAGYFVDGFTKTPSGNMIIEVNGCYWVRVQKRISRFNPLRPDINKFELINAD